MKSFLRYFVIVFGVYALVNTGTAGSLWYSADFLSGKLSTHCSYELITPVVQSRVADDVDVSSFVEQFNAERRADRDALLQRMQTAFENGECNGAYIHYFERSEFEITTPLYSHFVSFVMTDFRFTGGNHGLHTRRSYVYDSSMGKDPRLSSLADLFDQADFTHVLQVIEQKLLADEHFDPEFGWNGIKRSWNSLADITNYYVNQNGIVIFFNQYEVAPYVVGPVDVVISWPEALKDIGMTWTGEKMAQTLQQQIDL